MPLSVKRDSETVQPEGFVQKQQRQEQQQQQQHNQQRQQHRPHLRAFVGQQLQRSPAGAPLSVNGTLSGRCGGSAAAAAV